ncbi:trypsin-like peptidase domain-containing protein [Pseudomonas guariconensis]|uniref:trypsin-like peptidase domain-containing protein n=1 Tax=Pseudomonas guariconensis TaxID=1288410 RepID=UPI002B0591FB|nr:trypsin-like peptidase domain-containing protein [Pseudomonas guariconensis]
MSATKSRLQHFRPSGVATVFFLLTLWAFFPFAPAYAGLEEGIEAYDADRYSEAFQQLLPLAEQGNATAQRYIGDMYRYGSGTPSDIPQAVQWLKKAATQGDAQAQTDLGLLQTGLSSDSSPKLLEKKQGVKWLETAAQAGDSKAQYALGLIYLGETKDTHIVALDKQRGIEWISRAAQSSDPQYRTKAAMLLRILYSDVGEQSYDFNKALHWLQVQFDLLETRKAAEAGDAMAAKTLAYALSQKGWNPHDVNLQTEILKWYEQAIAGGALEGKAAEDYGCLFIYGNGGVTKDYDKARHWVEIGNQASKLQAAADAGDREAMAKMGDIYATTCLKDSEETFEKARAQAAQWYEKAVAKGDTAKAWELYDFASTPEQEMHWAQIAAGITTADGKPINTRYGGDVLFENLPRRDLPVEFRHAPGASWLSLHPMSVHAKPDASSPVTAEIGRFYQIYARPSPTPGWAALIAVSRGPYPDPFQYLSPSSVKDGKFVPRRGMNRQSFDPYVGYVPLELLGNLDEVPAPLPLSQQGLVPVPAYWAPIGIEENRRFVTDFSQPPYDALVRVAHSFGSCSGAIVLKPTIVVTSGHCFKNDKDDALVIIERGPNQVEKIPARIVRRALNRGNYQDWAVLRLKHAPQSAVTPLNFADSVDWSRVTRFRAVLAGYPGDLLHTASTKALGFDAPSISECVVDVARHDHDKDAFQIGHSCNQWFGASGGPFMVWNPETRRFELLALNTFLAQGFTTADEVLKDLFAEKIFKDQAARVVQPFEMKNTPALLDVKKDAYKSIPGLASVFEAYQNWTSSLFSEKATLSAKMIEVARAEAGLKPAASPYLDDPQRLGFWLYDEVEWSSRLPTTEARASCAQQCDESIVRPHGWTLQLGQKINWDELAGRDDTLANRRAGWIVVGGDLFYINKDSGTVTGVVRHFLNLKDYGTAFNRQFELWQRYKHLTDEYSDAFVWNEEADSSALPTTQLRRDNFGDDTPRQIPGGTVIKADDLALELGSEHPPVVIASIGGPLGLPGSVDLSYSAKGASYSDAVQQRFEHDLIKLTDNDKSRELVFYCHHSRCWLSYNSALRAIKLGYSNVHWFRGGLNTWAMLGLPMDWVKRLESQTVTQ